MPASMTSYHGEVERTMQVVSQAARFLQKVQPALVVGGGAGGSIRRSSSALSLSSLSLSQNSIDSSFSSSNSSLGPKVTLPLGGAFSSWGGKPGLPGRTLKDTAPVKNEDEVEFDQVEDYDDWSLKEEGKQRRCNWITNSSDEVYVSFHDEHWGVPTSSDNQLFELLTLSGLLIDQNWTEILKRRELYRMAFMEFDYNTVAKMSEEDIVEISSNKELKLAEYRVRSIVDNAVCAQKVAKEFGSFSNYIWSHVGNKPIVSKFRHAKSIPFRTPKSEAISKDMIKRGFRLVGPVIVYSFMQAAGLAMDHLVGCFRFRECVRLGDKPKSNLMIA